MSSSDAWHDSPGPFTVSSLMSPALSLTAPTTNGFQSLQTAYSLFWAFARVPSAFSLSHEHLYLSSGFHLDVLYFAPSSSLLSHLCPPAVSFPQQPVFTLSQHFPYFMIFNHPSSLPDWKLRGSGSCVSLTIIPPSQGLAQKDT